MSVWLLFSCVPAFAAEPAGEQGATLQLAAHIAHSSFSDDRNTKLALLTDYETVYGSIDIVPTRWPALVRRALVCQQLANRVCVRSSLEILKSQGGIDGLALSHMFEVSRFGMSAANIHDRLLDASDEAASKVAEPTVTAPKADPKKAVAPAVPEPVAAAPVPAPAVHTETPPAAAAVAEAQAASAPHPAAKKPRTLTERATAKLQRLGGEDGSSGYFLDALFIAIALCLILLFALYMVARSRKAERLARNLAEQEAQRVEALRSEEKVKADHDLWSEQLKSEVAIEAQKAHAEEVLRTVRTAADEALAAELLRFQMEQEEASMAFSNELRRLQDALRAEQAKNDDVVKSAKARADQAIDAYDQMAARELVYAHQQNDDLQDVLNGEKEARRLLEMKVAEALQQVEAHKQRELRLNEAIGVEQRGRASEARIATEKLKAAQQAASALQASLAATRALNADLERRADEAVKAAQHLAESRQHGAADHTTPPGAQRTF